MWRGQKASYTGEAHWLELKPRPRELRKDATLAEDRLWQALRGKKLGVKFRRQHPVNRYIVDFYSVEAGLAIEVDGPIHEMQAPADTNRQAYLEANGIRVLRFDNYQVANDFPFVLDTIRQVLQHSGSS